jgi:hypothetical protein
VLDNQLGNITFENPIRLQVSGLRLTLGMHLDDG